MSRRQLIAFFAFVAWVATGTLAVVAQSPSLNTSTGMTLAGAPLALRGYDPLSFFEGGTPQLGDRKYAHAHKGAAYRFTSAAHLDKFKADPERYLPQYGGFCAFGVSVKAKFDGDPLAWKIVDGKLYLNLDKDIQAKWSEDIPGNIAKANAHWTTIRDKAPSEIK